jgi:uncharacterized protein
MAGLVIRVADIGSQPRRFRLETDADWFERSREIFNDSELTLTSPFVLDLEAYCLGKRLLFRGEVTGVAEPVCGRCLEHFRLDFAEHLELLLEPKPPSDQLQEPGIELDAEELEIGRYSGEELDFEPVLRDLLLLSWPMAPRCGEDCKGLCPVCGGNRNKQACQCEADRGNKPFAALGKLLGQSRDEGR